MQSSRSLQTRWRVLQPVLHRTHPPVHLSSGLVCSNRPEGAYFHVFISPRHYQFLRFAFEGRAWQYKAFPSGSLCLHGSSPSSWRVLQHRHLWRFLVNQEKSKLTPVQRISFLGLMLDLIPMTARLSLLPSTLKDYVAAVFAHHDAVAGSTVGRHNLIIHFLRGARQINPHRSTFMPSWDLALILTSMRTDIFEPLDLVS